jgi:hypothetical protein
MISPKTEEEKQAKAIRNEEIKSTIEAVLTRLLFFVGIPVLIFFSIRLPLQDIAENTTYNIYAAEAVVYEKTFTPAHNESDIKVVPAYGADGNVSYAYVPTTIYVPDSYVIKINYNGYTLTLDGEDTYNAYEKGDTVPVNVTETFLRGEFQRGKIELAGEELDNGN